MPRNSRSRSRSRSSSDEYDSADDYDPQLVGQDGLHANQKATPARLKNPGKYTDRSMRRAHSKRSQRRERTASYPAVMGRDENVRGTCVNKEGHIKHCKNLVTRVNWRPTYIIRDKLPIQMLYAMLLDEHPDVVRTYDRSLVTTYLAGVIARALGEQDEDEPEASDNLFRFANNTVNILSQIYTMSGDVDPITVLAERYLEPGMSSREAYRIINTSIRTDITDTSVLNILKNLESLVHFTKPQVRLWAYDSESPKSTDTVLLRRGTVRSHPWNALKEHIAQSLTEFQRGGGEMNIRDDESDGDRAYPAAVDNMRKNRGRPKGSKNRLPKKPRSTNTHSGGDGRVKSKNVTPPQTALKSPIATTSGVVYKPISIVPSKSIQRLPPKASSGSSSSSSRSSSPAARPRTPDIHIRSKARSRSPPRSKSRSPVHNNWFENLSWEGSPPPTPGGEEEPPPPDWLKRADNFAVY